MITRGFVGVALAISVALASPFLQPDAAADDTRVLAPVSSAAPDSLARLQSAVEDATQREIPGAAGSGWVLERLDRSEPGIGGSEHIVARGVITEPGAPDTQVRLTGRYDPESGQLTRVSYRLQPADLTARTESAAPTTDTAWSVQQAVENAFAEVLPDDGVVFALDSAQASRVEGGGRRFEGSGIGSWGPGDARFVSFTMTLSSTGELVAFDYGISGDGEEKALVAGY